MAIVWEISFVNYVHMLNMTTKY